MTTNEAPGSQAEEPRRTAVRRLFLTRLDEAGLVRKPAMSAEDFQKLRQRLVEHLAYLPDPLLATLADMTIRMGQGPLHNRWPDEATVRGTAEALMPCPVERMPIWESWMRSRGGPEARDSGCLVELYRWLRRYRQPPKDYARQQILNEADDNRRWRTALLARVEAGSATDADRAWLDAYAADEAAALAFVGEGEVARARTGAAA